MILFTVLMFIIFGRMIGFAFRAAWGFTKVIFTLFFLPLLLIGLVIVGLIRLAWPLLVIIGIVMLIRNTSEAAC